MFGLFRYTVGWAQISPTRDPLAKSAASADVLLKAVQRNRQEIRMAIYWGYLGGIVELLLGLPVWIYMGVTMALSWTWYLMTPVIIWDAGFNLLVRPRRNKKPNDPGDSRGLRFQL